MKINLIRINCLRFRSALRVLVCGVLCASPVHSAIGQDAAPKAVQAQLLKIYHLKYVDASATQTALQPLVGATAQMAADVRTNALIVKATPAAHTEMQTLLEVIDTPSRGPSISMLRVKEKPSGALLDTIDMISEGNIQFTFDAERNVLVLSGRDDEIEKVQELIQEFELTKKEVQHKTPVFVPAKLRIVWMETGDGPSSAMMTPDLTKAIAPLKDVGISNLRVRGQMILNVETILSVVDAESVATVKGEEHLFAFKGLMKHGNLEFTVGVDDTTVRATVSLKPEQWAVLGAVGAPDRQTVFAIQRMRE